MPRGVRLTPEEREARLAEIARVRAEKAAARAERKKQREKLQKEREERKSCKEARTTIGFCGTGPVLDDLRTRLAKKAHVVATSSSTKAIKKGAAVVFVSSMAEALAADADPNSAGTNVCLVGPLSADEATQLDSMKYVWGTVLLDVEKPRIVGGVRAFASRISELLHTIDPKMNVVKVSLDVAALASAAHREMATRKSEDVSREVVEKHGLRGEQALDALR